MSVTDQQEHDPSAPSDVGERPGKSFRGLATFLSVLATPLLLFMVVLAAGGGHGTYGLAKALFPWTMMSTSVTRSITQPWWASRSIRLTESFSIAPAPPAGSSLPH